MGFGPPHAGLAETAGVTQVSIPRNPAAGVEWSLVLRVARELRNRHVDVVHVHNWSTSMYGIAGAALAGTPAVLYGSGGWETSDKASLKRRGLMRLMAPCVSRFTTVCEYLAAELSSDWRVDASRIHVVRTGIDLDRVRRAPTRAEARHRLGIPQDAILIGTVSLIRPVKRIPDLIRAVAELAARDPNIHLAVVGPCSRVDPQELLTLANDLGLGSRFHLPGSSDDALSVLPAFDVFVNCSEFEGASNALIEAMAVGLPVVASSVGGTPELVVDGRTGLLVPVAQPTALARAVGCFTRSAELRAEYGAAGRQSVKDKHSMSGMMRELTTLYRRAYRETRRLTPNYHTKGIKARRFFGISSKRVRYQR